MNNVVQCLAFVLELSTTDVVIEYRNEHLVKLEVLLDAGVPH
jgi:hypothetical protein